MDGIPDWLIFLIAVGIVYSLAKEIVERRCPRCNSWFSRKTLNEEKFDNRGLIFKNPSKVRYFYQCNECAHKWEDVIKIDNDPDW